jgi:hypothetical protein
MDDINHYILRVGDGENFINGFAKHLWAVKDSHKSFLEKVKQGDKLWFIRSKTSEDLYSGKIIAVADFEYKNERIVGPLVSLTPSNEELNWTGNEGGFCNIEIHYTNLYNLTALNLYTGQRGQCVVTNYNNVKEKLLVNLPEEYERIVYYSQITNSM